MYFENPDVKIDVFDKTVKILLESGEISQEQIQTALEEQVRTGQPLTKIIVDKGFITEAKIRDIIELSMFSDIDIKSLQIPYDIIRMIPVHIIRSNGVFPLKFENNKFLLAMVNPKDIITIDTINIFLGKSITIQRFKITKEEHVYLTDKYKYFLNETKDKENESTSMVNQVVQSEYSNVDFNDATQVEKILSRILNAALRKRAGQINFEPGFDNIRVRFKLDDSLYEETRLPRKIYPNFLNFIKEISGLEGEEKSFHYTGSFRFGEVEKKDVNFVVNGIRTVNGEKVILRPGYPIPDLRKLFYCADVYDYIEKITAKNRGLVLVLGSAGSGKTTTLYSMLQNKISNKNQLMTIEESSEHIFENYVSQVQFKSDKMDITDVIYEVSRHNPNVLLVQDIKDEKWCSLIEELALSGMLVLTSMRAYNIISGLKRLKRINFPNFASLQTIINQKLVRKLCPYCKVKSKPSSDELQKAGYRNDQIAEAFESDPRGCNLCYGGYKGLIAVFDVVNVSRELINNLNRNEPIGDETIKALNSSIVIDMKEYALNLLKDGITSFEEVNKIF